jgi:hypothetical protein
VYTKPLFDRGEAAAVYRPSAVAGMEGDAGADDVSTRTAPFFRRLVPPLLAPPSSPFLLFLAPFSRFPSSVSLCSWPQQDYSKLKAGTSQRFKPDKVSKMALNTSPLPPSLTYFFTFHCLLLVLTV